MNNRYFLGIDFGTSNTSLAYVANDPRDPTPRFPRVDEMKVAVDEDAIQASTRIPSTVAFLSDGRKKPSMLLGWQVLRQFTQIARKKSALVRRGQNIFLSVKSDMGSYRVYPHASSAEFNMPEKVACAIIRHIVEAAKQKHGDLLQCKVVVTVPASLHAEARKETLEAAVNAGFKRENIELVDEPVAALLDLFNSPQSASILESGKLVKLLVFDYGGGTLDLSLVRCAIDESTGSGLLAENIAISSYRRNGGNDVDREVMDQLVWPQLLKQLNCELGDLPIDLQQRIEDSLTWTIARDLKEGICKKVQAALDRGKGWSALQKHPETYTTVVKAEFADGALPHSIKTGRFEIDNRTFDRVMGPFLQIPPGDLDGSTESYRHSLLLPVLEILDRAGLSPTDLDYLVMHGGSCRNPWVRRLLKEGLAAAGTLFGNVRVIETPDIDTSVARGAALACYWKQCRNEEIIPPITSEEIGILTLNEKPVRLLGERERLPFPPTGIHTVSEEFYVPQAGLKQLLVPFYTGRQKLSGVVPIDLPAGLPKGCSVRIKFKVDRDKVLHWWYSIGKGDYKEAEGLQDPWTTRELYRDHRRVLAIRQQMHAALKKGDPISVAMELEEVFALYNADEYEEAELLALEFVARSGLSADAANALSLIYNATGPVEKDLKYAREAVRLSPNDPIFLGNLGYTLANLGQYEEAIPTLRKALSIRDDLPYIYEKMGDVFRDKKDEESARKEYHQAIRALERRNPDDPATLNSLRRVFNKLGDYDKARELQSRLVEVDLNERFQGDHRHRIAGPDSGF